jgi:hypothetical protein
MLRLRDRDRGERERGLLRVVARAGGKPDVGRVVHPHGGRDGWIGKQPLVDREAFARAPAHEHDVDKPLPHDLADLVAVVVDGAVRTDPGRAGGPQPGGGQAKRHVGILGICENEVSAVGVGHDPSELGVERLGGTNGHDQKLRGAGSNGGYKKELIDAGATAKT